MAAAAPPTAMKGVRETPASSATMLSPMRAKEIRTVAARVPKAILIRRAAGARVAAGAATGGGGGVSAPTVSPVEGVVAALPRRSRPTLLIHAIHAATRIAPARTMLRAPESPLLAPNEESPATRNAMPKNGMKARTPKTIRAGWMPRRGWLFGYCI